MGADIQIAQMANQLLWLVLILSLPVTLVASVLGLVVGLIQALTQIQDQTVAFVIKLVGCCIVIACSYHWMGQALLNYMAHSFNLIAQMRH